jgi:(1->4)-alpha-D-glucan 1-alpha-D-glucosylmutase
VAREHVCTYRLQLNANFGFADAASIVEYLAKLGVSHVYLSPITQAAPGSTHGYDVCDPTAISADLGGPEAYHRFCEALDAAGLGQIIDIVPNHMAVAIPQNRWLDDVLRRRR